MEKQQKIKQAIEDHIRNTGDSQNVLRTKIGISSATLSHIRTGKWDAIADGMWNKVGAFFGLREDWQLFGTPNFNSIHKVCRDAKKNRRMVAVSAFTGAGKTTALKTYAAKTPNSYYVLCTTLMTRRTFVQAVLQSMGLEDAGNLDRGFKAICERLNEAEAPLLIFDDAGKLASPQRVSVLQLVQLICDETEGQAGIVLAGTEQLQKYIHETAAKGKHCLPELKGRIQLWQPLARPTKEVVQQFAVNNGVTDLDAVSYLTRVVKDYRDIRNVLVNARLYMSQHPDVLMTAEVLAGLHMNSNHYQTV
jgi:DNA transposition AAA+ family ATPase